MVVFLCEMLLHGQKFYIVIAIFFISFLKVPVKICVVIVVIASFLSKIFLYTENAEPDQNAQTPRYYNACLLFHILKIVLRSCAKNIPFAVTGFVKFVKVSEILFAELLKYKYFSAFDFWVKGF